MSAQKNGKGEQPQVEAGATGAGGAAAAEAAPGAPSESMKNAWAEQIKKFAYATAGAVHISQDDLKTFISKLVEKGELAQKDGKKIVKDLAERVKRTVKEPKQAALEAKDAAASATQPIAESGEKLVERINASIQRVLHGMSIATRQDLAELGRQIDELDRKLGDLVEASTGKRNKKKEPAETAS